MTTYIPFPCKCKDCSNFSALEEMQKQNNKLLNIIADMLSLTPPTGSGAKVYYAYLEPYYKLHNMPLEPLEKLAEELEELHEKPLSSQGVQSGYEPLGG